MIIFVMTGGHKYCPEEVQDILGAPTLETWSYNKLFRAKKLPFATYIFSDFDRLDFWQLELAAKIYRTLSAAGATVLNDPAQVLHRLPLLKRLYAAGLNSFKVWDVAADDLPDRFPLFLRTRAAHRGTLTDLLHTQDEAVSALNSLIEQGYTTNDLMFVEYCAEPMENGVFRKLAAFRVGDEMLTTTAVHERNWQAKYGEQGVAGAELYQEEFDMVESNKYTEQLKPAFDIAKIHYGRVDFAVVEDRVQVYEINTNPSISLIHDHPFEIRVRTDKLFCDRLAAALNQIDLAGETSKADIHSDAPEVLEQQKRDRLVLKHRWTP